MMGKYDAVLVDLKPRPIEDLSHQEKVDAVKAEMPTDATALAYRYTQYRAKKDEVEAHLSDLNLKIEALTQLLCDSQDAGAEGWGRYGVKDNALRLPDGSTVRVDREPYGKVTDKEVFRLWCIKHGYERQLQLWPSTMNALVKERLMAGEEPPAGTEAYSYAKIVYTTAKKEEQ